MKFFDNTSDLINIVLFLSTGSLTLIGLLSFFSSLTIQPKIDLARQILNDIENQISKPINFNYGEDVINLFSRYKLISSNDFKQEYNVINTIRKSLILICIMWISIIFITFQKFNKYEIIYSLIVVCISLIIVMWFYKLIKMLLDIFDTCSLPRYNDLLNLNYEKSLDLLELVGKSMYLEIVKNNNNSLTLNCGFPLMFNELTIFPTIFSVLNNDYSSPIRIPEISINPSSGFRNLSDKYIWYKIIDNVEFNKLYNNIYIQLDIYSKNSYIKTSFDITKSLLTSNDFDNKILHPKNVNLIISNQSDILNID